MRFRWLSFVLLAALATPAFASPAWVNDQIYVPIRSGPGSQYRIINRGIKSGTQINFLGENGDWAHISYNGTDGYIGKQYVSQSPTAGIELDKVQKENDKLKSQVSSLSSQLKDAQDQLNKVQSQNSDLQSSLDSRGKQLDQLRKVAADPIRLDQANRKLNQQLSVLRSQLDQVKGENAMLRNDATSRKWITGVGILLLGLIGGLLMRNKGNRRRGNWAN